jgi:hypothetical protein
MKRRRVPLTKNRLDAIIEALAMRLAGPIDDSHQPNWAYTGALKWAQDRRDNWDQDRVEKGED